MKIVVLKSSPHFKGTSNCLTDEFIKGAKDSGKEVIEYDLAEEGVIHSCLACDYCRTNGQCIQNDKGNEILKSILEADAICLATPTYYFGISSQLKKMIDRFYSKNSAIAKKNLKAVFIISAGNDNLQLLEVIQKHFELIANYLNFENCGLLLASNCGSVNLITNEYYQKAYELGKNI